MKGNEIDPFYKVKNNLSNLITTDDLLLRPSGNPEGLKGLWPEDLSLPYRVVVLQSTIELPQAKLFHEQIFHRTISSITASFQGPEAISSSCGISRSHFGHWNIQNRSVGHFGTSLITELFTFYWFPCSWDIQIIKNDQLQMCEQLASTGWFEMSAFINCMRPVLWDWGVITFEE